MTNQIQTIFIRFLKDNQLFDDYIEEMNNVDNTFIDFNKDIKFNEYIILNFILEQSTPLYYFYHFPWYRSKRGYAFWFMSFSKWKKFLDKIKV